MATNTIVDRPIAAPVAEPRRRTFNPAAHGLRGIASMMVFWAHLLGGTAKHVYAGNPFYVALVWGPWSFGAWGVELFFVISGFVILPSVMRYSPGQFALRRFLRLYPLFFVFTLFFAALNAVTHAYPDLASIRGVIAGFLFLNLFTHTQQLTPNAWSLTFEVMFYALAAFGYAAAVRRRTAAGTIIVAILAAAFLFRYPIAFFFLAGALIRLGYDADFRPPPAIARPLEIVFALACIWLAGTHRFGFSQVDMASPFAWALMATTIAYFYLAIQPDSVSTRCLSGRAIAYLGTVSYSLYLVHPYTYFGLRAVFAKLGLFGDDWALSMVLFFAIATTVTLALTHVVHKTLEVAPYRWFFHQRVYRGANDAEGAIPSVPTRHPFEHHPEKQPRESP